MKSKLKLAEIALTALAAAYLAGCGRRWLEERHRRQRQPEGGNGGGAAAARAARPTPAP